VFVVYYAGSGLCDGLITRSEESGCMRLIACDLETSITWRSEPEYGCYAAERNVYLVRYIYKHNDFSESTDHVCMLITQVY